MPADDFGSTTATATDLGTVQTAPSRGPASWGPRPTSTTSRLSRAKPAPRSSISTATHYLAPHWTIQNSLGAQIASQAAADASFSVVAGQRYYVGFGHRRRNWLLSGIAHMGTGTSLAGDYNNNGSVDAADYSLWRNTLGSTSDFRADGDGNGTVDAADYTYWKQRFGQTSAASAASVPLDTSLSPGVPEPGAGCLISIAVLAAPWRRRRWLTRE